MLSIVPPPFRKNRGRGKVKAKPIAPPSGNQIIAVTHGEEGDRIVVSLNSAVSSIGDLIEALQVSVDGSTWSTAISFNNEDPLNVQFFMSDDVTSATQWRVPSAAEWVFENGEELVEPFEGEIG